MLKMFHAAPNAGAAAFWETTWEKANLNESLRFCEHDPLRPLMTRAVFPGARLLEGGCGRGHYVVYYGARGVKVTGLDFAQQTLRRLKYDQPAVSLCAGDVSTLPFQAETFDAYFSGGVVEHFEEGPDQALREAYRVLRPDGTLLVSVPYLSPLRALSRFWRIDRVQVCQARRTATPKGLRFWQYAFTVEEFSRLLAESGFRVQRTFPYAILYGLYDVGALAWLLERRQKRPPGGQPAIIHEPAEPRPLSLLKRFFVAEDRHLPLFGHLVGMAGHLCANMMMYVCSKDLR